MHRTKEAEKEIVERQTPNCLAKHDELIGRKQQHTAQSSLRPSALEETLIHCFLRLTTAVHASCYCCRGNQSYTRHVAECFEFKMLQFVASQRREQRAVHLRAVQHFRFQELNLRLLQRNTTRSLNSEFQFTSVAKTQDAALRRRRNACKLHLPQ